MKRGEWLSARCLTSSLEAPPARDKMKAVTRVRYTSLTFCHRMFSSLRWPSFVIVVFAPNDILQFLQTSRGACTAVQKRGCVGSTG